MQLKWILVPLAAVSLGACSPGEPESAASGESAAPPEPAAPGESAAPAAVGPPSFRGDVPMNILMRGPVTLAAEVYWESVMIVIDSEGEHLYQPETDEDWEVVWSAGIAIAESANLMMHAERALDQGDWLRMSNDLYEAGLSAARAAQAQDYERVFDEGEKVYNACTACHEQYMPTVQI